MDFSFQSPGARPSGQSSSIASERLRRAIERNRAKQAKREKLSQKPESSYTSENDQMSMGSMWSRKRTASVRATTASPGVRTRVAKPEDTEFVSPARSTRRTTASVNYTEPRLRRPVRRTTTPRRPKKKTPTGIMARFPYLFWGFCLFLLFRLILVDRGVLDYYGHLGSYERKELELQQIINENEELEDEILRIKKDRGYQKKLVRDHLGYISKDEYLVLFPKDS